MKTIFRYTTLTALLTAILAVGGLTAFAQDPCGDTDEARTALADKFRAEYGNKDVPGRKTAINTGKEYLEKYGACTKPQDVVDLVVYLKTNVPKMQERLDGFLLEDTYKRFDASVKASNFDETYTVGKEILTKVPDQLDVMIVLGSIGYDESYKKNYKYNADTIRFAQQAIAALEAGKTSKTFGIFQWTYKTKENALGWLNFTIGYINQYAQKNKKDALPYLYKASQLTGDTKSNPLVFESIALYYVDEYNKLTDELKVLEAAQSKDDTEEIAKGKVDAIKAKLAVVNGAAERAMDAYARAHAVASTDPKNAAYKDGLKTSLQQIYKIRFGKLDNFDSWIKTTVAKQMPDPMTAITPVAEPDLASTTAPVAPTSPATTTKPATPAPMNTAKPAAKPAVPASKPATTSKPAGSAASKAVVTKKVTK